MSTEQERKYQEALEQARMRMTHQALKLQAVFQPEDVVGLLVGSAIGVLIDAFGREKAREYFLDIAQGLDAYPDETPTH